MLENNNDKPTKEPQTSKCEVHSEKITDLEKTIYENAGGLKVRVYQLESQMDALVKQNDRDHCEIKKALSKNTWTVIGFCVMIIGLLIGVLLKG